MNVKQRLFELVRNERVGLYRRFGVKRIGIFGSCARGEESPTSDVDILVEFESKSFDNYMELKFYLEEQLGRRVDLVTPAAIKPRLEKYIMREVEYAA